MNKMFCERLKELRQDKKLSIRQLAKELQNKISATEISRWEQGLRVPTLDSLEILADYFGVSIDYLAGRQDY